METGYDAFISYSHNDGSTAERLQSALQSFARPWYRRRSLRVFRDTSNLAAEPSLRRAVEAALDLSRHVIVLASRTAAVSPWVEWELGHWLLAHPADSVILVRIDGTVRWSSESNDFDWTTSDAVPPALKGAYASEPLYVDIGANSALTLRDPTFQRSVAQIVARIRNVELDRILGEHVRRQRQASLAVAATGLVVVSLAGAGTLAYRRSLSEGRVALSRRLAVQSRISLAERNARLALLAGLASLQTARTREAYNAILEALTDTRHLVADIRVSDVAVDALALATEERTLITGDQAGSIAFWDLSTGEERKRHVGAHAGGVTAIAISPDGRLAASGGGAEGGVMLWDLANRESIGSIKAGPSFSLAFTPDGQWLLAGGEDGVVSAWDLRRQRFVMAKGYPEDGTIVGIATDGGARFATAGLFGIVRIRDRRTLRSLRVINPDPSTGASTDLSPDGRMVVMAGGRAARLWDLTGGEAYGDPYVSEAQLVSEARFTGDQNDPVALTVGSDLDLWFGEVHRVGFHRQRIFSLAVDRRRALLATGSVDGTPRLWSLYPRNSFVTTIVIPEKDLTAQAVALSPDGDRLAVGAARRVGRAATHGLIYLVNLVTGEFLGPPLDGHDPGIVDLAFSSRGQLASASGDGTVRLWALETRTSVVVSTGAADTGAVDIAFSPDGQLLALARAGRVVVWNVRQVAPQWRSATTGVTSIAFSPNEGELALGTTVGAVRRWTPASGREETLVSPSTNRSLTGWRSIAKEGESSRSLAAGRM